MFEKIFMKVPTLLASLNVPTANVTITPKRSILRRVSHHSKMMIVSTLITFGGQLFMLLVASIAVAMLIFVTYYSKEALEMIASDSRLPLADRGSALIAGIKLVTDTIFPVFSVVLIALTTAFAGISYVKKLIMSNTDTPPDMPGSGSTKA